MQPVENPCLSVGDSLALLTHTGLSVAEVAPRAGFATPPHLAASLRAATGQTPTELRRRSWAARSGQ